MKPFDSKELVARVKAVLRRFQPAKTESVVELKCVEYPDLTVNLSNYSVMYNGHPIDMPPKELELLYFLAASPNQVFTREQLLSFIIEHHFTNSHPGKHAFSCILFHSNPHFYIPIRFYILSFINR